MRCCRSDRRPGARPDRIDPWFVDQLLLVAEIAEEVRSAPELTAEVLRTAKRHACPMPIARCATSARTCPRRALASAYAPSTIPRHLRR